MTNFTMTALSLAIAIPAAVCGWQAGHTNLESFVFATCAALLAALYVMLYVKGRASKRLISSAN